MAEVQTGINRVISKQRHSTVSLLFVSQKPLARRVVPKKTSGGDEDNKNSF